MNQEIIKIEGLNGPKSSIIGNVLLGLTGTVAVGLTVICVPFVTPALRKHCLPFIPATNLQIRNILTALKDRKGAVVGLGSGDGRIVAEVAKHNFIAHGVELNPWLVIFSRLSSFRQGVAFKTKFFRKDLWKFNLQPYDNVVIFGVEQMMLDLESKILAECRRDCRIVACRFPLPNIKPEAIIGSGIDTVWIYNISKGNP